MLFYRRAPLAVAMGADVVFMDAADIVLFTTAIAATLWWLPQWVVLIANRDTSGVSPATWALVAANCGLWAVWGFAGGWWLLGFVEAVQAVGAVLVLLRLKQFAVVVWCTIILLTAAQTAQLLGGLWLGVFAIVSAAMVRIPQMWRVWVRKESAGVSALAWVANGVINIGWTLWAVLAGATALAIGSANSIVLGILIALGSYRRPKRPSGDSVTQNPHTA